MSSSTDGSGWCLVGVCAPPRGDRRARAGSPAQKRRGSRTAPAGRASGPRVGGCGCPLLSSTPARAHSSKTSPWFRLGSTAPSTHTQYVLAKRQSCGPAVPGQAALHDPFAGRSGTSGIMRALAGDHARREMAPWKRYSTRLPAGRPSVRRTTKIPLARNDLSWRLNRSLLADWAPVSNFELVEMAIYAGGCPARQHRAICAGGWLKRLPAQRPSVLAVP
jgi:hypothetical protein